MKYWISAVVAVLVGGSPARAAGAVTHEIEIQLPHPLSSGQRIVTVGQLGKELGVINAGASTRTAEDQRDVVEAALASLKYSETKPAVAVENTYLWYLEEARAYRQTNPWLAHVTSGAVFTRIYAGMKLLRLHENLGSGWRDESVARVLPEFMYQSFRDDVLAYLKTGNSRSMDDFARALETLGDTPGEVDSSAGREAHAEFLALARTRLMPEVEANAFVAAEIEPNPFLRAGPTLLSAATLGLIAKVYYTAIHAGYWVPIVVDGATVTASALYLNRVLNRRQRARMDTFGRTILGTVESCERALARVS